MRRWMVVALVLATVGCRHATNPELTRDLQSRTLYTCCNIHYEGGEVTDANYFVGATLPLGTPVKVEKATGDSIVFSASGAKLVLRHEYGAKQESARQYFDKVLVGEDPRPRVTRYSPAVQRAIEAGRVERGMTREQVIAALGYPPAHRTPSLQEKTWTYWYNRWVSYQLAFDDFGKVSDVIGRPAPTSGADVKQGETVTRPSAPLKKRKK